MSTNQDVRPVRVERNILRIASFFVFALICMFGYSQSTTCDCWIDPDAGYTTIDNNSEWDASGFHNGDDGSYGPINLPFSFYLYGQNFNTAYININGNVSFGTYYGTYSSSGFPVNGFTMVAPFWADVDLRGPGAGSNVVQFKVTPTALYVNWTNVGYYSQHNDKENTFQLIITDGTDPVIANGANVSFCYKDMQWTTGDASQGTNGFGGTPARVGANHGNGVDYIQFGAFDQIGNAYDGPFGNNDGIDWLDDQYFSFSTVLTSANVPPIISGQSVCDSLVICAGVTSQLDITFLSPEPSQVTTIVSSAPTLSNYTILSNTPGLTAEISTSFTPGLIDVGYHTINFEGTDNGVPALSSTLNIVVCVLPPQGNSTGTLDACSNDAPTDLMTTLVPPAAPGGDWTDPNGAPHSGIFDPTVDIAGIYLYNLSLGGCQNLADVTVTISEAADAGIDNVGIYCSNGPVVDLFSLILGSPDSLGQWFDTNGQPYSGMYDPSTDPAGDYDYVITGTGVCVNDTSTIGILVSPAVFAGGDTITIHCEDEPIVSMRSRLAGTPDLGGTWYDPSGNVVSDDLDPSIGPQGVYQYIMTTGAPCLNDTAFLEVEIQALPNAGTDNSLVLCADAPNEPLFPLLGGADATGSWIGPDQNPHDDILYPATDETGIYTYIVLGAGQCAGRVDSAFIDATINMLPEPQFTLEPNAGCAPLSVNFINSTDTLADVDCQWDLGDGSSISECVALDHLYQDPGSYSVTLEVTSQAGCVNSFTWANAVLVEPAPMATFTVDPDPATGDNPTVHFQSTDPYAVEYAWLFDGSATANSAGPFYTFPDQVSGEYEVCLAVMDVYGCADTSCRMVEVVVPSLYVPNAFTPDGDGNNEVFLPSPGDMVPDEYDLQIYDRWGQLVFQTTDLNEGWNGSKGNSGATLPQGVYVWRISARGKETVEIKDYFGHVTLLK